MMAAFQLSEPDAVLLMQRQDVAEEWWNRQLAIPEVRSTSGGQWLDPRTQTAVVATTSPEVKAALEAQGLPKWLVVKLVSHTIDALYMQYRSFRASVALIFNAERSSLNPVEPPDEFFARVLVDQGVVEVEVPGDFPEIASAVREHYTSLDDHARSRVRLVAVEKAQQSDLAACPNNDACGAPLRGGIALYGPPNGGSPGSRVCTAGFIMWNRVTQQYKQSTAAHCTVDWQWWYQREVTIGQAEWRGLNGRNFDFAAISIVNNNVWKATGHVWKPHNELWNMTSYAVPHFSWINDSVCHTGMTSQRWYGEQCGLISVIWQEGQYETSDIARVDMVNDWICQGDSGAAVEYDHMAFGMIHATDGGSSAPDGNGCGHGGGFSWMSNVVDGSDYDIVGSP